jgi:hypothetical protein
MLYRAGLCRREVRWDDIVDDSAATEAERLTAG